MIGFVPGYAAQVPLVGLTGVAVSLTPADSFEEGRCDLRPQVSVHIFMGHPSGEQQIMMIMDWAAEAVVSLVLAVVVLGKDWSTSVNANRACVVACRYDALPH